MSERPSKKEQEESVRIWPIYDDERPGADERTLNVFYLLPFKEEGLERNLFPLFRVYRLREDPSRGVSINLLWGFYKKIKNETVDYWEVAHLIGVKKSNGVKHLSLLKGLFWYRRDGASSDLRIFFLPFRLRLSHSLLRTSSLSTEGQEVAAPVWVETGEATGGLF